MLTLQQIFSIFNVNLNSPDGEYSPNQNIYMPVQITGKYIAEPSLRFFVHADSYHYKMYHEMSIKASKIISIESLKIEKGRFKVQFRTFCLQTEPIEPALLFLSKEECLDYIMEYSYLKRLDNVRDDRIKFYIKAAKINFAAYDVLLKKVFNVRESNQN